MNPYRELPSVTEVLAEPVLEELVARHGHEATVDAVRSELDEARLSLRGGAAHDQSDVKAVMRPGQAIVGAPICSKRRSAVKAS